LVVKSDFFDFQLIDGECAGGFDGDCDVFQSGLWLRVEG
jgi:hypothetical protein